MKAGRRINVDLALVFAAIAITIYGLAIVFSAGQTDFRSPATGAWKAQVIWALVGIGGAYAVSRASVRLIEWMTVPAYVFTLVLLAALLVGLGSGAGTATSTAGWVTIRGHPLGPAPGVADVPRVLMPARGLSP